MGFEKFGRISFTSQTKVEPFVDYLEQGEIRAAKCPSCQRVFFPPRADCAWCLTDEMEWVKVEGEGTLVSYTKANYAPTGFENDVPYILALADFNGVKVFARISQEVGEEDIKTGMKVKVVPVTYPGDQLGYELVPA